MIAEVAGDTIASANSGKASKILKRIVSDHLEVAGGADKGRALNAVSDAVPPAAYTEGGGGRSLSPSAEV